MQEKSKVFIQMGNKVGIKVERKSQRGIVARKFLPKLEKFEQAEFSKACPKITFHEPILVNEFGREPYYI